MKFRKPLVAALLVIPVLAVGAAAAVLMRTEAPIEVARASDASRERANELLAELIEEVRALRGDLVRAQRVDVNRESQGVEIAKAPARTSAVTESVIEVQNDQAVSQVLPRPTPVPPVRNATHQTALARLELQDSDKSSREHAFWTYQQVLDAFGPPDRMSPTPEGGLSWLYDHGTEGRQSGFLFCDGFAVRVWN